MFNVVVLSLGVGWLDRFCKMCIVSEEKGIHLFLPIFLIFFYYGFAEFFAFNELFNAFWQFHVGCLILDV